MSKPNPNACQPLAPALPKATQHPNIGDVTVTPCPHALCPGQYPPPKSTGPDPQIAPHVSTAPGLPRETITLPKPTQTATHISVPPKSTGSSTQLQITSHNTPNGDSGLVLLGITCGVLISAAAGAGSRLAKRGSH